VLFWISTRTAPGISQVLSGCRVRHPQYSKKLFVRFKFCMTYLFCVCIHTHKCMLCGVHFVYIYMYLCHAFILCMQAYLRFVRRMCFAYVYTRIHICCVVCILCVCICIPLCTMHSTVYYVFHCVTSYVCLFFSSGLCFPRPEVMSYCSTSYHTFLGIFLIFASVGPPFPPK